MDSKPSLLVTTHTEFLRAKKDGKIRFYPANAQNARADAIAYDDNSDFTPVFGFGVYDSTVSTSYAVALYATLAEAEAHKPTPPPAPASGLFKTPGVLGKKGPTRRSR